MVHSLFCRIIWGGLSRRLAWNCKFYHADLEWSWCILGLLFWCLCFAVFWEMLCILCWLCGVRKPLYGLWLSLQDVGMDNNMRNVSQICSLKRICYMWHWPEKNCLQKMGICRMALSFSVLGFVQSKLVAYSLQVLNLTPNKTNWDMAEIWLNLKIWISANPRLRLSISVYMAAMNFRYLLSSILLIWKQCLITLNGVPLNIYPAPGDFNLNYYISFN